MTYQISSWQHEGAAFSAPSAPRAAVLGNFGGSCCLSRPFGASCSLSPRLGASCCCFRRLRRFVLHVSAPFALRTTSLGLVLGLLRASRGNVFKQIEYCLHWTSVVASCGVHWVRRETMGSYWKPVQPIVHLEVQPEVLSVDKQLK